MKLFCISGFFELLFASPYARNAAIVDPSPGMAPIKVPKPEDLIIVGKVDLNSKNVTTLSIFCFEKTKVLDANFFTGSAYEGSVMMASVFGYDPNNNQPTFNLNAPRDNSTVVHEFGHYLHLLL